MNSVWVRALRLAADNRKLRAQIEQYRTAVCLANDTAEARRIDLRRVGHERDVALATVINLRIDFAAMELVTAELMRSCPADASELGDVS